MIYANYSILFVLLGFDWAIVDCVSFFLENVRPCHLMFIISLLVGSRCIELLLLRSMSVQDVHVSFLAGARVCVEKIFAVPEPLIVFGPNLPLSTVETDMRSRIALCRHPCAALEWIMARHLIVHRSLEPATCFFGKRNVWAGGLRLRFLCFDMLQVGLLLGLEHVLLALSLVIFLMVGVDLERLSFIHALCCCFLHWRFLDESSLARESVDSFIYFLRWNLIDLVDESWAYVFLATLGWV